MSSTMPINHPPAGRPTVDQRKSASAPNRDRTWADRGLRERSSGMSDRQHTRAGADTPDFLSLFESGFVEGRVHDVVEEIEIGLARHRSSRTSPARGTRSSHPGSSLLRGAGAHTDRQGAFRTSQNSPFHDSVSTVRTCPDRAIDAGPAGSLPSSVRRATSLIRRFAHDAPSNSRASISARSLVGRRSFVPTHFAQHARSASRSSPRAIVERWHSGFGAEIQWTPQHHDHKQRDGRASKFLVTRDRVRHVRLLESRDLVLGEG
jgi:hypothetical protein